MTSPISLMDRFNMLTVLTQSIQQEISSLVDAVNQVTQEDIHLLTEEAKAAVNEMSDAAHAILDSLNFIHDTVKKHADLEILEEHLMKINEACMFQDITGQRLSKIIKKLEEIDQILSNLEKPQSHSSPSSKKEKTFEESLLNGPQLPGQGYTQEEIDRMLNDKKTP